MAAALLAGAALYGSTSPGGPVLTGATGAHAALFPPMVGESSEGRGQAGDPRPAPAPAAVAALRAAVSAFVPYPQPATRAFAKAAGIELYLPTPAPVAVGYHEAGNPDGLELAPLGHLVRNANRTKFTAPTRSPGPAYLVMSSRGRHRPATSAVDIALRSGGSILAPASGIVAEVARYRLYDAYRDTKVTLIPLGRPDLRVVIIHLTEVPLHAGDRVVAGATRLGAPREFPFRSQVNDYIGPAIPHVHIEVKRIGPPGLTAQV